MSDHYTSGSPPSGKPLPLFDGGQTRIASTSVAAAAAARKRRPSSAARVLEVVTRCGRRGATDEEIRFALNLPESTARPRRRELVQAEQVVDSGRRRRSHKDCLMTVWVAPEFRGLAPRR